MVVQRHSVLYDVINTSKPRVIYLPQNSFDLPEVKN